MQVDLLEATRDRWRLIGRLWYLLVLVSVCLQGTVWAVGVSNLFQTLVGSLAGVLTAFAFLAAFRRTHQTLPVLIAFFAATVASIGAFATAGQATWVVLSNVGSGFLVVLGLAAGVCRLCGLRSGSKSSSRTNGTGV